MHHLGDICALLQMWVAPWAIAVRHVSMDTWGSRQCFHLLFPLSLASWRIAQALWPHHGQVPHWKPVKRMKFCPHVRPGENSRMERTKWLHSVTYESMNQHTDWAIWMKFLTEVQQPTMYERSMRPMIQTWQEVHHFYFTVPFWRFADVIPFQNPWDFIKSTSHFNLNQRRWWI